MTVDTYDEIWTHSKKLQKSPRGSSYSTRKLWHNITRVELKTNSCYINKGQFSKSLTMIRRFCVLEDIFVNPTVLLVINFKTGVKIITKNYK